MNEKLGLDPAFLNEENPFDLFKAWMEEAKKSEPNDPNAVNVATVDSAGQPDNRVVFKDPFSLLIAKQLMIITILGLTKVGLELGHHLNLK